MNQIHDRQSILVVEDDLELGAMIQDFLTDEGYVVSHITNGSEAIEKILAEPPDLVLLDHMLPGKNGTEVIRAVRDHYRGAIVMLTAKDDEMTEVNTLNRGADAFLEKPVRPHVLLAHIRANLRLSTQGLENSDSKQIRVHDLVIDLGKYEASLEGTFLELTSQEFQLVAFLAQRAGVIVSREDLYQAMKGIEYDGVDRAMDMRISTLRNKMNDDRPPYRYIKTIRGKGYMLAR